MVRIIVVLKDGSRLSIRKYCQRWEAATCKSNPPRLIPPELEPAADLDMSPLPPDLWVARIETVDGSRHHLPLRDYRCKFIGKVLRLIWRGKLGLDDGPIILSEGGSDLVLTLDVRDGRKIATIRDFLLELLDRTPDEPVVDEEAKTATGSPANTQRGKARHGGKGGRPPDRRWDPYIDPAVDALVEYAARGKKLTNRSIASACRKALKNAPDGFGSGPIDPRHGCNVTFLNHVKNAASVRGLPVVKSRRARGKNPP